MKCMAREREACARSDSTQLDDQSLQFGWELQEQCRLRHVGGGGDEGSDGGGECVEVVVDLVPIVTPLVQLHLLSRLVGVGGMLSRRGVHVLGRRNDRAWSTSSCRRGQSSLCWRRNLDLDGWHPKVPGG